MPNRARSEQELFTFIHEREHRSTALMLRSFPRESFDVRFEGGRSTREWALAFILQEQLLRAVCGGDPPATPAMWPASPEDIVSAYEDAHRQSCASLACLTEQEWNEALHSPDELGLCEPVRRGELLWIALEDLVDQVEQLAEHRTAAAERRSAIPGSPESKELELSA